jgi:hypothetical protein
MQKKKLFFDDSTTLAQYVETLNKNLAEQPNFATHQAVLGMDFTYSNRVKATRPISASVDKANMHSIERIHDSSEYFSYFYPTVNLTDKDKEKCNPPVSVKLNNGDLYMQRSDFKFMSDTVDPARIGQIRVSREIYSDFADLLTPEINKEGMFLPNLSSYDRAIKIERIRELKTLQEIMKKTATDIYVETSAYRKDRLVNGIKNRLKRKTDRLFPAAHNVGGEIENS